MIITCSNSVGDDPTLPSRFCVSRKSARINAARPAAAAHYVRRSRPRAHREVRAGCGRRAGIVPRDLMDITQGRLAGARGVESVRVPESRLRREVIEIRAANGNVEGSGSKSTHCKALCSYRGLIEIVASGGTRITRGHKHGYTLCCCLLPKAVEELISCRTQCGFAGAETKAHHRVQIVIDDVERRKIGPRSCQCAFRHHQINRCLRGDHPRHLNVQVGFALTSGGATDSWIGATYDNVGRIDWKAEQVAEIGHVLGVNV